MADRIEVKKNMGTIEKLRHRSAVVLAGIGGLALGTISALATDERMQPQKAPRLQFGETVEETFVTTSGVPITNAYFHPDTINNTPQMPTHEDRVMGVGALVGVVSAVALYSGFKGVRVQNTEIMNIVQQKYDKIFGPDDPGIIR